MTLSMALFFGALFAAFQLGGAVYRAVKEAVMFRARRKAAAQLAEAVRKIEAARLEHEARVKNDPEYRSRYEAERERRLAKYEAEKAACIAKGGREVMPGVLAWPLPPLKKDENTP